MYFVVTCCLPTGPFLFPLPGIVRQEGAIFGELCDEFL